MKTLFRRLPDEVAEKVFRRLDDFGDLARFSLVSKHWYRFIHSKQCWRRRATIGCMYIYDHSDCSSYPVSDGFQAPLSCNCKRHVRSACVYLNTGLLPGQNCDPCISPEKAWIQQPWPGDYLISYLDSSYGLLCAYDIMSDKLYLFDPCKSPPVQCLVSPPLSDTDCNLRNLSFHVDLLDNSFVVILITSTLQLLVYKSLTGSWSRSTSGYPGPSYDLNEPTQPHPIIGNSIYFLGKDGKIWSYSIDIDSWSHKKFLLPEDQFGEDQFGEWKVDVLIQIKGRLMLVGINEKRHLLSTWLCNEEGKSYLFLLLSSFDIDDDLTLTKATAANGLVCVQSCIVDNNGKTQVLVFAYCSSIDGWRYLDSAPHGEGVYSVDYFVVEARLQGLGAIQKHFQIMNEGCS